MAGGQGFEPRLNGPEPFLLPLDDSPEKTLSCEILYDIFNGYTIQ